MTIEAGLYLATLVFLLGATIVVDTVLIYGAYLLWMERVWHLVHGHRIQYGIVAGYAAMVLGLLIGLLTIEAGLFGLI